MLLKRIMYGFGLFSFLSIMLYFWGYANDYKQEYLVSGISFFFLAGIVYFLFVFLYFKSGIGKKIVFWGLLLIVVILSVLLVNKVI
ncbi:hypothetical protein [Virgibacillus senegalensis]|uniref:hypothetical protein n=1 Tax=Virgibacillus senegalensis TaxID=1499679 RepID=UPI00069D1703|nr:hypothetical protein [Virgibacillus senegalensis]